MSDFDICTAVDKVARMIKALESSKRQVVQEKEVNLKKVDADINYTARLVKGEVVLDMNAFQSVKLEGAQAISLEDLDSLHAYFKEVKAKLADFYEKRIASLAQAQVDYEANFQDGALKVCYQTAKVMVETFHY